MGWFDDFFGNSDDSSKQAQPQLGSSPLPVATNPSALAVPSYADFYKSQADAINNRSYLSNVGKYGWLGAIGQDGRDLAALPTAAPDAYLKLVQAQTAAQNGLLDQGQTQAALQRNGLYNSNAGMPAGFASQLPQGQQAPIGAPPVPGSPSDFNPNAAPQGQPGAPPQQGAPFPAPLSFGPRPQLAPPGAAPQGAPPVATGGPNPLAFGPQPNMAMQPPQTGAPGAPSPLDTQRLNYARMAQTLNGIPKYLQSQLELSKLAQVGAGPGMAVNPATGQLVDAASGRPVGDTRQWQAQGAGMTSGAQAAAALPYTIAGQDNQAANQRTTDLENAQNQAKYNVVSGYDKTTGEPITASRLDIAAGKLPNFAEGANPYREPQIKEITEAQAASNDAAKQQNAVEQLSSALDNAPTHGKLGPLALQVLGAADSVGLLDPEMRGKLASGELANMDSNAVVAAIAKQAAAGRVPLGIYNQVAKTKPGIATSEPGLMLKALAQDFQREQDRGDYVARYYSTPGNGTKLDAQTAFDKTHPIEMYQSRVIPVRVKTADDYKNLGSGFTFQDTDGNIRVKP